MQLKQARFGSWWLEGVFLLYLLALLGVYTNGAWLTQQILQQVSPPIEFPLLAAQVPTSQTWLWSIDTIPTEHKLGLWLAPLVGAVVGLGVVRLPQAWLARWPARWWFLGLALLAVPGLWYFRGLLSFGDAPRYTALLGTQRLFVMHGPLTSLAFAFVHRVLGGSWPPESSVALTQCLLGGAWVYLLLNLARDHQGWPRWLLVSCVLPAGGAALFFGYREMMPLALVLAVLYIGLALPVLQAGRALYPAALALGLALAAHGQMFLLLPSFGVLLLTAWRAGQRHALWLASLLVVLPLVSLWAWAIWQPDLIIDGLYGDALGGGDSSMFVPLWQTGGKFDHYTFLSFAHLTELLNAQLVIAPFVLLCFFPAATTLGRQWRQPRVWFLSAIGSAALLFCLLWNADLGMQSDWDLFTPPLLLLLLVAALLWPPTLRVKNPAAWAGALAGVSGAVLALNVARFAPLQQWDPWYIVRREIDTPTALQFGDVFELVGYNFPQSTYGAGDTVTVKFFWRLRQATPVDYTAGVQIIRVTGESIAIVAQDDHRPVTWYRYSSNWAVGEWVPDAHVITLPPDLAPGDYQVWLVVYDLETLTRLPVNDDSNLDYVKLAEIQVVRP